VSWLPIRGTQGTLRVERISKAFWYWESWPEPVMSPVMMIRSREEERFALM
jgi:hypothetical protein